MKIDLIEQLGGYGRAKDALELPLNYGFTDDEINKALLKYRREHNIFEVGDKVIKTHPKNTIIWTVLGVYKNGGVWLDFKGFCWKPPRIRHATPQEIQAGGRLEVCGG